MQGNFISLTVVIRPTTGEGSVQDIGNLAITRAETSQPQDLLNGNQHSGVLQ
jgi:hypothetical protein